VARILACDEIDSTNSEAFRQAAAGNEGPLWITARRQTAGRGRSGRSWVSPDGNLFATLLLTLGCGPREAAGLSLVAGIAVHDALEALAAAQGVTASFRLKWPNDVLIGEAKLSGILIETATRSSGGIDAAIGVGINLAWHPDGLGRAATDLTVHGLHVTCEQAVAALARSFHHWVAEWQEGRGFPEVREAWLARSIAEGTPIAVSTAGGRTTGAFGGIDGEGMLLLVREGGTARITFGDVSIGG
jgi:BirA family biotin operon repressor/biotin-[acetyl-CoA-carboxylase] ligase